MLLVAAADHDHAIVAETILDLHDLAGPVGFEHLDDVERFVQDDLHSGRKARSSRSGAGITRILRPAVKTSIDPSSLLAR